MPDIRTFLTLAPSGQPGWLARQRAQIARLFAAIELAVEVQRERRMLRRLDARALKDLGLNGRADAEASRPFWDLPRDRLCG